MMTVSVKSGHWAVGREELLKGEEARNGMICRCRVGKSGCNLETFFEDGLLFAATVV